MDGRRRGLKSFQTLGVSPGSGGNPRVFIRLNGERSSFVVRLLGDWEQRILIAWGDNIPLPAAVKILPESETSFVNFDFDKSQTLRFRFKISPDGKVTGLALPSPDGKSEVFARRTEKPPTTTAADDEETGMTVDYVSGIGITTAKKIAAPIITD